MSDKQDQSPKEPTEATDDEKALSEEELGSVSGGASAAGALKTIAAAQTDYNMDVEEEEEDLYRTR